MSQGRTSVLSWLLLVQSPLVGALRVAPVRGRATAGAAAAVVAVASGRCCVCLEMRLDEPQLRTGGNRD